ncbi:uncharacterized protein LOC124540274 [Vanessa cardui]|uniref:uncharacterized protein LOC124540274 n=1 Tax=Vanessa cardui TaxID=171605 RepID=UPI001F13DB87|nr:uncharacterized protein LOC124540274 [Vanessa cardui]
MLALFLLAQHVLAKDTSNDSYIVKKIESCPDEGYFFKRDLNFNAIKPNCYLCFCQDNGTAVCWLRQNNRCDTKYYYHVGRKKREHRSRRSPGLSDIFFRDASRDFFNKRMPEQCKPHESSFSEGCPPADWCIGCTVCDCDANGRWDCHVLSFCPDGTGKKQMKKRRSSARSKIIKRQLANNQERKKRRTTTKTTKKPTRKSYAARKTNKKSKPQIKKKVKINGKQRKQIKQQKKPNRRANTKKPSPPCRMQSSGKGNPKRLMIKSNTSKDLKKKNDLTAKFAESILKKVMASVEKIINESQKGQVQKDSSKLNKSKNIKKQSTTKHRKGTHKNSVNIDSNKIKSKIVNNKIWSSVSSKKANEKIRANWRRERRKREVTQEISNHLVIPLTATNVITTTIKSYNVEKDENKTTENYPTATETNDVLSVIDQTTGYFNEEMITKPSEIILNKPHKSSKTFLNTYKDRNNSDINLRLDKTIYNSSITCGRICELKKTIRDVIVSFNKINTTRIRSGEVKANHFNILPSLKKVFRKIFLKKTNFKNVSIDARVPFRKRKIIKVLCKHIDSCKVNQSNQSSTELQFKLDKLRGESLKILKSVRIIRGLLRLLDIHENNASTVLNHNTFTDNDLNKLNVILKDEYASKYGLTNLTETQRTQINYIKENTLNFIESIEKFSKILVDVINILTNGDKRNETHRLHSCVRDQEISKTTNSKTINDKLKKLTSLLLKYNLVQNKFMKKMYNVLISLEDKANTTVNNKTKEVSVQNKKSDYTDTVENYIKNIFKNLRKLKAIPERLNSKTRKKRAALYNDDAVEYLLMLMEYLFKQNKPRNVAPVHDGIDLLIEAIRNAPDIKPIQKNVLSNDISQANYSEDPINFRKNNVLAEEYKATINIFNNKFKPYESNDNEHEYFNDFKDFNKEIQTSTQPNFTTEKATTTDPVTETTDIGHVDENVKLDKLNEEMVNKDREEIRRFEVFVDDVAEDDTPVETTTVVMESETSTATDPTTESLYTSTIDDKTMKYDEANDSNNKVRLEWIEETYDSETERVNTTKLNETTTEATEIVTKTIKNFYDKYADPVSSMSREDGERKLITDNESYHKQKSLLNTLDYGPDKELDSDSREVRDNGDSSPLYFV